MTDSKLKSVTESITNIIPGWAINFLANIWLLPLYAADYASGDMNRIAWASFVVGIWFTLVSVARSYFLRRLFERFGEKENLYTLLKRLFIRKHSYKKGDFVTLDDHIVGVAVEDSKDGYVKIRFTGSLEVKDEKE